MANRVTIDVEARFVDKVSAGMNAASKSADKLEKSVEKANKGLGTLAKKNAKPKLGADDNAFTKKIREAQRKAEKLGKTKVSATLGAVDKATAKIGKVTGAARAFGSKVFRSTLSMADKASHVIGSVTGAARSFAGRTFSATVNIVDKATTPLRKIKDSLFSIKTLIGAITAGVAAKQFVLDPINLADQYSGAKMTFSTLLGAQEGEQMMKDLDEFARVSPFDSAGVIGNAQKMIAMGWDATNLIDDMEILGNAAASTGNLNQGLESIVRAMAQIKTKGKLSTEELNQLAEAGIAAKAMLAEQLGYGTGDAGIAAMTKELEDGAIGSEQAIEALMNGMKKFDGLMDTMANEQAEGLWSQIQDTFQINIFRRWGQGLQDGAKKGLGSVLELLDSSEGALEDFGDLLYDIGKEISNWGADNLEKFVSNIKEITATDTWKNASLTDKVKMLWDGAIGNPFSDWWQNTVIPWWNETAEPWLADKAGKAGESIGKGLTTGLLALFGATELLEEIEGGDAIGANIAVSFVEGFKSSFDGSAITQAFVDAIADVWNMLPWWGKLLVGGYGVGKVAGGVNSVLSLGSSVMSGIQGLAPIIGSTGNSMMQGTGLLNILANLGYKLTGGAATAGGYFGAGTAMSGGLAAGAGAGAIAAGATALSAGNDLYHSYKAYKVGDKTELKANLASGTTKIGGVAAGAALGAKAGTAIGALFGGVGAVPGALIGAGIGGIAGWIGGEAWAKNIRESAAEAEAAKFETEEMKEAIKDAEISAEELAMKFERAVNSNIADHFGDIELTMEEIAAIADKIVIGDMAEQMQTFTKATETAKTSLQSMQASADALDRLNWKVGLGLKLDEVELAEYSAAIEQYIASAEKYVEDKHYEFNAAVTLLLDVKEGDGKSILESGNTFYSQLKEQMDGLGSKLTDTVKIAFEDGVITLDEQAEIVNLQNQIAEITNKLAQAETEAEFETIKIKFGESHISSESFKQLQEELQTQLEESSETYENALTVGLTNLKLQYEEGLIKEDEYERLKGVLEESFQSQMEALELKVQQVQIDIIGEAYENVLGEDAVAKLNAAIEQSLKDGISPAEWTAEDVRRLLNAPNLSEETAAAITALLSSVEFKVTANGDVKINANYEEPEPWKPGVFNTTQNANVGINPSYDLLEQWKPSVLNTTQNANVSINPSYNLLNSWTPPSMNKTIYPTITVSPTYKTLTGGPYKQNANGNIIQSKTLSWVGEEGPEAIIPLVPGRRARGLKLWEEAGRRLGVQYHANGGIVGDDSTPIKTFDGEIHGSGEKKIEINMGGVTIEIQTDGNKTVVENIEEQEQAIAEKVAAIFKNVFSAQFANMPLKEGT